MTPEERVKEQAQKLGGRWRMDFGRMPVVVLTTVEAGEIIEQLEKKPTMIFVSEKEAEIIGGMYPVAIKGEVRGETVYLPWNDIQFVVQNRGG